MKRRDFLKTSSAAAAVAAPTIIPSSVLGADAPSNKITIGLIGCGGQGTGNLRNLINKDGVQAIAVCDPDANNRGRAKKHVDGKNKNADCAEYGDYRELCAREDLDTVIVGTPDHWHALACVEALGNGKDVYCEKPITHLFAEGQAVYKAGRQAEAHLPGRLPAALRHPLPPRRGDRPERPARQDQERRGRPPDRQRPAIDGKVARRSHPKDALDYDLWCGPSRMLPYHKARLHWDWRWCLDYGGGQLMDWIGHHNDIAHWGLEQDKGGPVKVEAKGFRFPDKGMWDNPIDYEVLSEYAGGYTVSISNKNRMGTKWIGEDGWVYVTRGKIESSNREWITESNDRGPKKGLQVERRPPPELHRLRAQPRGYDLHRRDWPTARRPRATSATSRRSSPAPSSGTPPRRSVSATPRPTSSSKPSPTAATGSWRRRGQTYPDSHRGRVLRGRGLFPCCRQAKGGTTTDPPWPSALPLII